MKYFLFLFAVTQLLWGNDCQQLLNNIPGVQRVEEWKKRRVREDRMSAASKDLLGQLEKQEKKDYILPYQLPQDKPCSDLLNPTYAKATCTSYPGKVVCQLGRYTFVINNGEHKMDPEVIERFAAMVYHRTQEGDANFDVAVDTPYKEQCYCPETPIESTTMRIKEAQKTPVFIECTPLKDERKLCNPSDSPSEVIYTCKKKEIGIGKRMVISVDEQGTVSDGELVLPYSSLTEKRIKRQKGTTFKPWDLASGTRYPEVRNFTDTCSRSYAKWCGHKEDESKRNQACQTEGCVTKVPECSQKPASRGKRKPPDNDIKNTLRFGRPSWIKRSYNKLISKNKAGKNPLMKRKRQTNGLCTTCPPSTTCPTPTTTCGAVPDLPKDVPCCQSPSPKPPCCPQTEPPSCPSQQRKRRALRSRPRKRKKPPHHTWTKDFKETGDDKR